MRKTILVMLGAALLLVGCVSGVPVSVVNHSASALSAVTVSGKGFSESIGSIAPGATETIRIRPRVATSVKVALEVNGQRRSTTTEGEIENDDVNIVVATVGEDLSLTISTELR